MFIHGVSLCKMCNPKVINIISEVYVTYNIILTDQINWSVWLWKTSRTNKTKYAKLSLLKFKEPKHFIFLIIILYVLLYIQSFSYIVSNELLNKTCATSFFNHLLNIIYGRISKTAWILKLTLENLEVYIQKRMKIMKYYQYISIINNHSSMLYLNTQSEMARG